MEMKDVKIVTVVLGHGGFLATKFIEETGQLILWPNDAAIESDEDAMTYPLSGDATKISFFDPAVTTWRDDLPINTMREILDSKK